MRIKYSIFSVIYPLYALLLFFCYLTDFPLTHMRQHYIIFTKGTRFSPTKPLFPTLLSFNILE